MASNTRPFGACGSETAYTMQEAFGFSQYACANPIIDIYSVPSIIAHGSHCESLDADTIAEINSSDIAGITMADGHKLGFLVQLPNDIDLSRDIEFRIILSNSEAVDAAKLHAWTCHYAKMVLGTTAIAAPAVNFDTECGTTANIGANILQAGTWGKILGASVKALGLNPADDMLAVNFALGLTGAADISVYRVQMRYWRRQLG